MPVGTTSAVVCVPQVTVAGGAPAVVQLPVAVVGAVTAGEPVIGPLAL
jgi:hypothetical protein